MCKLSIEEIKRVVASVDIVDVIRHYLTLKPKGRNYVALCPFHLEKTPSFVVSPEKQIYTCFGCDAQGDAVMFVKEYEKLDSMSAAAKIVAKRYNIPVTETTSQDVKTASDTSQIIAANKLLAKYFRDQLLANKEVKKILVKQRGFQSLEEIDHWHIGYSPFNWNEDNEHLQLLFNTFTNPQLQEWGIMNKKGGPFFRDRIMFGIQNLAGHIVGFGGRAIDKDASVKYLNTPETPAYDKSSEFYGFLQSKSNIKEHREAILVEGYFDVTSMHRKNEFSMAACGTALTEKHAKAIARFAKDVYLMYDGDKAGFQASIKHIPTLWAEDLYVHVLADKQYLESKGKLTRDPDNVYMNHSLEDARQEYYTYTAVEFLAGALKGSDVQKVNEILERIIVCPNPIRREVYLKELGKEFQFSLDALIAKMNQIQAKRWGQFKLGLT